MSLSSLSFILFVAISVALYYAAPKKHAWAVLLVLSYVFYASAGLYCLPFIIFTTAVSYTAAVFMTKRLENERKTVAALPDGATREEKKSLRRRCRRARGRILAVGVILHVGMLAALKLLPLTSARSYGFLLPLGISFYTFRSIGYMIDVYREKCRCQCNFLKFALLISYFPLLTLGPISRYSPLADQLYGRRTPSWEEICPGVLRVIWGYFKKTVVADALALPVGIIVERRLGGGYVILLAVIYSAEIYADFTGGIDIAIGVSRMFGIRLEENFDRPFASSSTAEYWNRWHISMGKWFTDYVFYPLSVSGWMMRLSRSARCRLGRGVGRRLPVYLSAFVTWSLTGLWHGFGWNYLTWGWLNCSIILVSQELQPVYRGISARFPRISESGGWRLYLRAQTFMLMGLVRLLDLYRSVPVTFSAFGSVFAGRGDWRSLFSGGLASFGLSLPEAAVIVAAIIAITAVSEIGERRGESVFDSLSRSPARASIFATALIFATLVFGKYGYGYHAGEFIYTQF